MRRFFSSLSSIKSITPVSSTSSSSTKQKMMSAIYNKPILNDNHGRFHKYLRLSVTEKCSFRCRYCMPAEGVQLTPNEKLLTTDEMLKCSDLFIKAGVEKIRITGGESLVHKDIDRIVSELGQYRKDNILKSLCMTTNGLVLSRHLQHFKNNGMTNINISLDTLVEPKFELFTRRKGYKQVWKAFEQSLDMGFKVKLNCVVMNGKNEDEINDFVELTKDRDFTMVFIELMPFDSNDWKITKMTTYEEMKNIIINRYGQIEKCDDLPESTARTFKIPGYKGKIGFITSMTNNFCGGCDRIRLLSTGEFKICLFDNRMLDLRTLLRNNMSDNDILEAISHHLKKKHKKHAGKTIEELANSKNIDMVKVGG